MIRINKNISKPIYLQVKDKIYELILNGVLQADAKLPSTRKLAKELGINRNTILAAYEELESEGLLNTHVGRGTFVADINDLVDKKNRSGIERFNWSSHVSIDYDEYILHSMVQLYKIATHHSYISFGGAIPDEKLLALDLIKRAFNMVVKEEKEKIFNYGPVEGYLPLREYIAMKMNGMGIKICSKDIFVTSGSQQALEISARILLKPGDYVITEEPTYTGALSIFSMLKAKIIGVPMQHDGINIGILEKSIKRFNPKLIYIIPNYHNPTGIQMSFDKRREFMSLVDKFNIPVIEDDVCGDLRYEGQLAPPLKALDRKGQVVYISSWSKILIPAFRVGWAVVEDDFLREKFKAIKGFEDVTSNIISQAIIHKFCLKGYMKTHLNRIKKEYKKRRDAMLEAVEEYFPESSNFVKPNGGLVIWVSFPDSINLNDVFEESIKKGILFAPGSLFYHSRKGFNELRLGFAPNEEAKIKEGISMLGKIIKDYVKTGKSQIIRSEYVPML